MSELKHRIIKTNGINMHIAEQGEGPLIVLCHGFPEGWYSWRHQLSAFAQAGYHVVAPDQRGYGQTDRPEAIEAYNILKLAGDIVGLVQALGEERAIIVGHDWGAPVTWTSALLRPDIFYGVGLLSVPFIMKSSRDIRPTDAMRMLCGEYEFYQLYFQEPGKAEAELEADVRKSMLMMLYSASGNPPPEQRWRFVFNKGEKLMDTGTVPDKLPDWLTEQDLDYFTEQFTQTGFRGGLNWYRNIDRAWELTGFLNGAKLMQPTLFIAGDVDPVIVFQRQNFDSLAKNVPNLTKKILLPDAGHWIQQERPDEVNKLMLEFFAELKK